MDAPVEVEFRTTVVKPLCTPQDLEQLAGSLSHAPRYTIQSFMPSDKVLDQELIKKDQYTTEEMNDFRMKWERKKQKVHIG